MHNTRPQEVRDQHAAKLKVINDRKRESGELKEIAEKAFRTRRERHGEEGINEQYVRI